VQIYTFTNSMLSNHNGNDIEIEAFHPGEFLKEEIEERSLLKKNVAKSLNILPHHLSEIFAGKGNISATLAVKLEKLLGVSSHYWLGMQMEYDLFKRKRFCNNKFGKQLVKLSSIEPFSFHIFSFCLLRCNRKFSSHGRPFK